jgi:hypothetical protein
VVVGNKLNIHVVLPAVTSGQLPFLATAAAEIIDLDALLAGLELG